MIARGSCLRTLLLVSPLKRQRVSTRLQLFHRARYIIGVSTRQEMVEGITTILSRTKHNGTFLRAGEIDLKQIRRRLRLYLPALGLDPTLLLRLTPRSLCPPPLLYKGCILRCSAFMSRRLVQHILRILRRLRPNRHRCLQGRMLMSSRQRPRDQLRRDQCRVRLPSVDKRWGAGQWWAMMSRRLHIQAHRPGEWAGWMRGQRDREQRAQISVLCGGVRCPPVRGTFCNGRISKLR